MKIETFIKRSGSAGNVLWTRIHCDCCSAVLEYEGERREAPTKLTSENWSVGSTGVVRCKNCKERQGVLFGRALIWT